MTVIPTQGAFVDEDAAVKLARYAKLIGYPETLFFGIRDDRVTQANKSGCRVIWTKDERDNIGHALAEAQDEIENLVGYPLTRRWFVDQRLRYKPAIKSRWCKIVAGGIKATAVISAGVALDHTADPAENSAPVSTTVTDVSEIHIYHPGTMIEIYPSALTLVAGAIDFKIPRARLVMEGYLDNPRTGLDYNDTTIMGVFEQEVDVLRVYNDPSTNATLIWPGGLDCVSDCDEVTTTACEYILNPDLGYIRISPGSYNGVSWTGSWTSFCRSQVLPTQVDLYYYAGLAGLSYQMEDTIIRLAHAKMPFEPCGCDVTKRLWERDRHTPDILSAERLNCPFGLNDGAWVAFQFAQKQKVHRGGVM
jgi:hypothetical protein